MSTHIIDEMAAVRLSDKLGPRHDISYIVAFRGGDNNVISCQTNRRASDWYPVAVGHAGRCMRRIVVISSDMEGGMTRICGNRRAKPETMIRRMRNILAAAPLINSADAPFRINSAEIKFKEEVSSAPHQLDSGRYDYDRCLKERGNPDVEKKSGDHVFHFDTHSAEDIGRCIELIPYREDLYRCLQVYGTRH